MSQEDIFEVERLEKAALEHEAWMHENPEPACATCKECYSERDSFPCVDCNILDSSKSVSYWIYYEVEEKEWNALNAI